MPDRPRYVLLVEDLNPADPVPTMVRLRALLKSIRRGFRLRCVKVMPTIEPDPEPADPAPEQKGVTPCPPPTKPKR